MDNDIIRDTYTSGQYRQHARLLRERYDNDTSDDALAGLAQADKMLALAELMDANAGVSPAPEQDCTITDTYPIVGAVVVRGGKVISIQHPWIDDHADALEDRGIKIGWAWCYDPRAGVDQGRLVSIYIGTREAGPRVMWDNRSNTWSSHKSRGNYGKNWSHGGNWSSIGGTQAADLSTIAPDLAAQIQEVIMQVLSQSKKIAQAEAKLAAANKRILACAQRDIAASAMRQASHPAYPGQEGICIGNAARCEELAKLREAEADLILAKAGL